MTPESALMETYMVVALAFAVFAAVTAVGTSLVLGMGYERVRNGLERVKEGLEVVNKQTGYFADAIFKIDHKVAELDKSQQDVLSKGLAEAKRAEGLVKHAESLVNEAKHEVKRHKDDIDLEIPELQTFESLAVNDDRTTLSAVSESTSSEDKEVTLQMFGATGGDIRFM